MYSYKQGHLKIPPNGDKPIDDFDKKLDEMLEKYLYKYIESYRGTPLKTPFN